MVEPVTPTRAAVESFEDAGVATHRVSAEVAALTHRGQRESNEDSYAVFRLGRYLDRVASNIPEAELASHFDESGHLMIIADGVGGHEGGEVASRTALLTALQLIVQSPKWALKLDDPATRESEIRGLLARSKTYLKGVHAALRERAAGDPSLQGMGTTLTGAYTVGIDLFVLHVGDSRAYVLRRERLVRITHDHTLAQQYADLGAIPQDSVDAHPLSHVLTRAVGGPMEDLKSDMHHLDVEDGDRLLLCSDGLTKVANEDDITAVMQAHPSSEECCRALVELALERGGPDNITVIVAGYRVV